MLLLAAASQHSAADTQLGGCCAHCSGHHKVPSVTQCRNFITQCQGVFSALHALCTAMRARVGHAVQTSSSEDREGTLKVNECQRCRLEAVLYSLTAGARELLHLRTPALADLHLACAAASLACAKPAGLPQAPPAAVSLLPRCISCKGLLGGLHPARLSRPHCLIRHLFLQSKGIGMHCLRRQNRLKVLHGPTGVSSERLPITAGWRGRSPEQSGAQHERAHVAAAVRRAASGRSVQCLRAPHRVLHQGPDGKCSLTAACWHVSAAQIWRSFSMHMQSAYRSGLQCSGGPGKTSAEGPHGTCSLTAGCWHWQGPIGIGMSLLPSRELICTTASASVRLTKYAEGTAGAVKSALCRQSLQPAPVAGCWVSTICTYHHTRSNGDRLLTSRHEL